MVSVSVYPSGSRRLEFMADDQLTKDLRGRLADFLWAVWQIRIDDPHKTSKPFLCLNPNHRDKHPSMYYYKSKKTDFPRVKCHVCGFNKGIFDLADWKFGCGGDFNKQKAEVMRVLGMAGDPSQTYTPQGKVATGTETTPPEGLGIDTTALPKPKKKRVVEGKDFTKDYEVWHNAVGESTYFWDRGLNKETIAWFKLGYIHNKDPHKCMAVIPCTPHYYVSRYIDPLDKRYKNLYKVETALFNEVELDQTREPVFVVEGAIDAMSVWQLGFRCLATNSTGGFRNFIDALEERMPELPHLIIIPDNDERKDPDTPTGSEIAIKSLSEELTALNIAFTIAKIPMPYKDTNQMLKCDSEVFLGHLKRIYDSALETPPDTHPLEEENMAKNTPTSKTDTDQVANQETTEQEKVRELEEKIKSFGFDSCFQAFAKHNQTDYFFPTGLGELDDKDHLDGGLYEGLTILGAQNTIGKSSLALQIASNVVLSGDMAIYFSTEQSPRELVTKLISMHTEMTFRQVRDIVSPAPRGGITKEMEERFGQFMLLADRFSERLFFVYGRDYRTVSAIRETTQNIVNLVGMDKPPLIIVDYLQMLQPPPDMVRATEKQITDYNVLELKDISSHFGTAVLGISSLNRSSYGYDMSDSAFKESGAIEYGCDCLMGLQFSILEKMDEEEDDGNRGKKLTTKQYEDEKKKPIRHLQVKIMKQRNGICGVRAYLNFETAYSRFIPTTRSDQKKDMNKKESELFG